MLRIAGSGSCCCPIGGECSSCVGGDALALALALPAGLVAPDAPSPDGAPLAEEACTALPSGLALTGAASLARLLPPPPPPPPGGLPASPIPTPLGGLPSPPPPCAALRFAIRFSPIPLATTFIGRWCPWLLRYKPHALQM